MRILFLAHRIPYPPNKGDKIRAFNILRHLARRHEVHLACLIDDPADMRHVRALTQLVRSVRCVRMRPTLRKAALALPALLGARSISVSCFYSSHLQRQIDDLIGAMRVDAVFCSSSPMAEYVFRSRRAADLGSATRLMDLIDVDSIKWRQYAERAPAWTAWLYRHEAGALAEYETRIARDFDRVLVVSAQERACFPDAAAAARIAAVSNGVDLQFFAPRARAAGTSLPPKLVFTGVMDYPPNIEGVQWFVQNVWGRVRDAVPDACFFIVGSRPTAAVRQLDRHPGVVVTGFVEDVRDYLGEASACVVPLQIARGIQNKILEGMAMGKAVVCTSQAFEGLNAAAGTDIIVADGAEAFAAATIALLKDPARATQVGARARACVERHYSWDGNLAVLDSILSSVSAGRAEREMPATPVRFSAAPYKSH